MSYSRTYLNVALSLILAASLSIPAANAEPGERDGRRGGPPQEAIEACVAKVEGDACSFSGRRGEAVEGSCIVPRNDEETLACAPAGGPRGLEPRDDREADTAAIDGDIEMNWEDALANAAEEMSSGYGDWRLPEIKEFRSIVEYSYAPGGIYASSLGPTIDTTTAFAWFGMRTD